MKWSGPAMTLILLSGLLLSALTILPVTVRGSTLYVGGAGPGNHSTIQEAVALANPGDMVFVYSGTYPENVAIAKTISLTGQDVETTIVTTDGTGNDDAILVATDWVNITGFTVTGAIGYFGNTAGIRLTGTRNVRVEGNKVIDNSHGILLESSTKTTLADNVMVKNGMHIQGEFLEHWNTHRIDTSNTVNDLPVYYLSNLTTWLDPTNPGQIILANCSSHYVRNLNIVNSSVGIEVGYSSNITITGNLLSNHTNYGIHLFYTNNSHIFSNTAVGNDKHGIWLYESHNNMITENDLSWNGMAGIFLTDSSTNEIKGNQAISNHDGIGLMSYHSESDFNYIVSNNASSNTWFGVWLDKGSNNTIANNTASQNGREGIHLFRAHDNAFISNNARNNTQYGIGLLYSDRNSVSSNNVTLNGWLGAYLTSSSGNAIFGNNFADNTEQGFDNTDANEWDDGYPSGGNYWSNYTGVDQFSGPNQNEPGNDGIGDTPYVIDSDSRDGYPLIVTVVGHNTPPTANLGVGSAAEAGRNFTAYATSSSDMQDPTELLEVRWDWENDGIYDTEWSANKTATHQYPIVDYVTMFRYHIRLQVKDTGGLTDSTVEVVTVYPWSNDPPTCNITSPTGGQIVSGTIMIRGSAQDDVGVQWVEVGVGGDPWTTVNGTTSWSYEWDTTNITIDEISIRARSYDGEYYSLEVQVYVWVGTRPPPSEEESIFEQAWFWAVVALVIISITVVLLLVRRRLR